MGTRRQAAGGAGGQSMGEWGSWNTAWGTGGGDLRASLVMSQPHLPQGWNARGGCKAGLMSEPYPTPRIKAPSQVGLPDVMYWIMASNKYHTGHHPDGLASNYTPYEGVNLANQKSRYLAGSWREASPYFIVILIYIIENERVVFRWCLSVKYELNR